MSAANEASSEAAPSLLIFGPSKGFVTEEALTSIREDLHSNPILFELNRAVRAIPDTWRLMSALDPTLSLAQENPDLNGLVRWILNGQAEPKGMHDLPNIYTFPVNFVLQIAQYAKYLRLAGQKDAHQLVLQHLRKGGAQGFCVGFLAALTVSSSATQEELSVRAAQCLRLALCIGAYVDLDAINAEGFERVSCVSVRSRSADIQSRERITHLLREFPQAYVASITDETAITVTASASHLHQLTERLITHGFSVKSIQVQGRFHCDGDTYTSVVDKITRLCVGQGVCALPTADKLYVPLRSVVDSQIIEHGSLLQHALENTLLKVADWYGLMKTTLLEMKEQHPFVTYAGCGNPMPPSLLQESNLQVVSVDTFMLLRPGARHDLLQSPANNGISREPVFHESTSGKGTMNSGHPSATGSSTFPPTSIAIVGVAGRFPGAASTDELWKLILGGKVTVSPAPDRIGLKHATGDFSGTKWWGNFLDDFDSFDHKFFKKSPREAIAAEPQQRKLLEVVYEALESSGYFSCDTGDETFKDYGTFIGSTQNNYVDNLSQHAPSAYGTIGTSRGCISGTVNHYYGWTGPAMTIDTTCSSSLVAIHNACRAIQAGDCSRAVAGGTNIFTNPVDYRDLKAAGFLSPTGQCKPFDEKADGYCRGEAVAVVILKALSTAIEENDHIYGVIAASAVNQNINGSHITVPHPLSQERLYRKVMDQAGVSPHQVSYVEAHGTGTGVGDPIEMSSLRKAFGSPTRGSILHVGSVKGNIGHCEASAGVVGLIKVLLMMEHQRTPPQASYSALNHRIPSLSLDRMAIPTESIPWDTEQIACVSSYGASGSNAAVLVRAYPAEHRTRHDSVHDIDDSIGTVGSYLPLILTAASEESMSSNGRKLLEWIQSNPILVKSILLSDILFNLASRANHHLPLVVSTPVSDMRDLESRLEAIVSKELLPIKTAPVKPVIMVFGGQENDHVGVSEDMYHSSAIFRRHLRECHDRLRACGQKGIIPDIFRRQPISDLTVLHTALFSVQYSSARAWIDCGLKVDAVIGHSFGQLTALCIASVLSLDDALKLVAGRATLMQQHWGSEPGSMLFMQANKTEIDQILDSLRAEIDYAEVACYNGSQSHVVVGSSRSIEALQSHIANSEESRTSIRAKRLQVTNGFHSKYTETLLPYLTDLAKELTWRRPSFHLETTDEYTTQDHLNYELVAHHTRQPVFFERAIKRLVDRFSKCIWLEAGCASSVMQLVRGSVPNHENHLFLSSQLATAKAQESISDATLKLWNHGVSVQHWQYHLSERTRYRHLNLPPYQFQKTRHWLPYSRRPIADKDAHQATPEVAEPELLSLLQIEDSGQATFRVALGSKRYRSLTEAHVMSDKGLMPASLIFETIACSALRLQKDTQATTWVPTVSDLEMKAPIALDAEVDLLLILTPAGDAQPCWSFSMTTQMHGSKRKPVERIRGSVVLTKRNNFHAVQRFKRFERLTGHRRWRQVMETLEAEIMHGRHLYKALNYVVRYGEAFRGLKKVSCTGSEAAGEVRISVNPSDPPEQRLTDAPMIDSFMQLGGFMSNYFSDRTDDVFIHPCSSIEHIEIGPAFSPDAGEWMTYATMTSPNDDIVLVDVYVLEAKSQKMVCMIFGMQFTKTLRANLFRALHGVKATVEDIDPATSVPRPAKAANLDSAEKATKATKSDLVEPTNDSANQRPSRASTKRDSIYRIIAEIADIAVADLNDNLTLDELGIDSLGATELINEIRSRFGVNIDLNALLFLENIRAVSDHIDSLLGITGPADSDHELGETKQADEEAGQMNGRSSPENDSSDLHSLPDSNTLVDERSVGSSQVSQPVSIAACDAFDSTRQKYEKEGPSPEVPDYWSEVYPDEARLIMSYLVSAFKDLGCDLQAMEAGVALPKLEDVLPQHAKFVQQMHVFLQEQSVIELSNGAFVRSDTRIDDTPGTSVFKDILFSNPKDTSVAHLVHAIGPTYADCLRGKRNSLQTIFGDSHTKKHLDDLYQHWPMLIAPRRFLGDFLADALTRNDTSGKFRLLEVGAGTGGTTHYVVNHLQAHGIPFEYHFTDISKTLVQKAKKRFKSVPNMTFGVLDVEVDPPTEFFNAFHVVISANCIHATRDVVRSLANIRRMTRNDGTLCLVEITCKPMFVMDAIFGLFEGWWSFEDGRTHALMDEEQWAVAMKQAGFEGVLWTGQRAPESEIIRMLAAFPERSQKAIESLEKNEVSLVEESATTFATKAPMNTHANCAAIDKVSLATDRIRGESEEIEEVGIGRLAGSTSAYTTTKSTKATLMELVYKKVGDLEIRCDVYCPDNVTTERRLPIALMIHGGNHILFTRKDIRPPQTRIMLDMGLLPVSLSYRHCPEVKLAEGPMADVRDALRWAREELPHIQLDNPNVRPDPDRVVAVGWSSGGHLALSLGFTAPQQGLKPPDAIMAFYSPSDYEADCWQKPIHPVGAEDEGHDYDVLEAVEDGPITDWSTIGAWEPFTNARISTNPRSRIVLHMNWKAQTLPVLINGLPSRQQANKGRPDIRDWNNLPQPSIEEIRRCSPRAQVALGNYKTPTFLVHGTADDLVPCQQSQATYEEMKKQGVEVELVLVPDALHVCDASTDPESPGWKAVLRAYEWLGRRVL